MRHLKFSLLLIAVIALAACTNAEIASPAATQEAVRVFYPPSMQFWADSLANCASHSSQIALYYFPLYTPKDMTGQDILLGLGPDAQATGNAYIYQVGQDRLVVVVNADNPTTQLSREMLEQIFSGELTTWMEGKKLPIQVWALPNDDPYSLVFNDTLMAGQPLTSEAHLAPDADAMIEAISQNPSAIGFLPKTILDSTKNSQAGDLKIVALPAALDPELLLPVVAITQTEPKGLMRQVMVCLQNTGE